MTMGTVCVTSLAARVNVFVTVTITSTLLATSSRKISGRRSRFPSADRRSRIRFWPSTLAEGPYALHECSGKRMDRLGSSHLRGGGRVKDDRHPVHLRRLLRLRGDRDSQEGEKQCAQQVSACHLVTTA